MSAAELPDFLPLFLEYLSTLPAAEACDTLGQPAHILAALAERLRKRRRPTKRCSARWSRSRRRSRRTTEVAALLALPDPDATDLAALDAAWEDEPVTFGPGAGDGCKDGLIARVRGGLRPAPDMPAAARHRPAAPMRKRSCAN